MMLMHETRSPSPERFLGLPVSPYVALPVAIFLAALLALPLYGDVMEQLLWLGVTVGSMCGF
jgi:hypothetical protein